MVVSRHKSTVKTRLGSRWESAEQHRKEVAGSLKKKEGKDTLA